MDEKLPNIDKRLIGAYRAAHYRITDLAVTLRIDALHPELDKWLLEHDYTQWSFLTAVNPRSRLLPAEENAARQAALQNRLRTAGYRLFPAQATDPAHEWPPEPSFWVPGLRRNEAVVIARHFEQHAFVHGAYQQFASLIWIPEK